MGDPADDDEKRPSGLPAEESEKRRVSDPPEVVSLRSQEDDPKPPHVPTLPPPGLGELSTSARLRLQLAPEHDADQIEIAASDGEPATHKRPVGLRHMTTSARLRLELALDDDDDEEPIDPKTPPVLPRERLSKSDLGRIPFDAQGRKVIASLSRWIGFSGLLTLTIGALTGLSYLTGEGSVAHVVVGILASAVSIWQLLAVWSLRKVLSARQQRHHMVHAFGHIRSALLLKAVLVFAAMVLGCFTFSIAGSLLFLLG